MFEVLLWSFHSKYYEEIQYPSYEPWLFLISASLNHPTSLADPGTSSLQIAIAQSCLILQISSTFFHLIVVVFLPVPVPFSPSSLPLSPSVPFLRPPPLRNCKLFKLGERIPADQCELERVD